MTPLGESLLREELKKLKTKDRADVVKAIAEAREFGDLKENAEYHAAKEQQGLIESRIKDIESKLTDSQVIDVKNIEPMGKVIFGANDLKRGGLGEEIVSYQNLLKSSNRDWTRFQPCRERASPLHSWGFQGQRSKGWH